MAGINISSVNARKGQLGQTDYSAVKTGMHKALAQEVARTSGRLGVSGGRAL